MVARVCINLLAEDPLSEAVLRKILATQAANLVAGTCYGKMGYGYVKKNIQGFQRASAGMPLLALVDLESNCAPQLVRDWLVAPLQAGFLFRVAVREVESWLIADKGGLSQFLGVSPSRTNLLDPDSIDDPKRCLVDLARRSRKRDIRMGLAPRDGSTARVGPEYNPMLSDFVERLWSVDSAVCNSDSLRRAVHRIQEYDSICVKNT
jgi:hypothetical protein